MNDKPHRQLSWNKLGRENMTTLICFVYNMYLIDFITDHYILMSNICLVALRSWYISVLIKAISRFRREIYNLVLSMKFQDYCITEYQVETQLRVIALGISRCWLWFSVNRLN